MIGSVSLVVNYFVSFKAASLDYAFLVGLYEYIKDTLEKRRLLKKCVAFTGDNCNTMFGRLPRNEQGNNVFAKLKKMLNSSLIGLGCSAHVLNNFIHHWAERMNIDIENNINKIYQYFSIYTVRTEQLKE